MHYLRVVLMAVTLGLSTQTFADTVTPNSFPKEERAFVDVVGKMKKAEVLALLGEPVKAEDVKLKDSGRVVASIWHYHFINQSDATGELYPTTELDFIDDQVREVVFLNGDGTEKAIQIEADESKLPPVTRIPY